MNIFKRMTWGWKRKAIKLIKINCSFSCLERWQHLPYVSSVYSPYIRDHLCHNGGGQVSRSGKTVIPTLTRFFVSCPSFPFTYKEYPLTCPCPYCLQTATELLCKSHSSTGIFWLVFPYQSMKENPSGDSTLEVSS